MSVYRTVIISAAAVAMASLTACGSVFRDRSGDYRVVERTPALVLPAGQDSRPIRPLFAVPAGPDLSVDPNKRVKVPPPKPLVISAAVADAAAQKPADAAPQLPVLSQDGNGYAVLSIAGDFNPIWDRLDLALRAAGVKIDDRNQSVGLYYLSLADSKGDSAIYQLRMARGQSAYVLSLQKDTDTLAPQAMTKTLFDAIVSKWPAAGDDVNGKARPSVHR